MRRLKQIIQVSLCTSILALSSLNSSAQLDDVGLRLGITATKLVTRDFDISLLEQFRFNHELSTVDAVLSDIGFSYSIVKGLKASLHYRFINKNKETYYSKRHRLYADISYRHKFSFLTLTLRERIQDQYSNIYSSENGKIPVWIIRSKLSAKFDLKKKYTPYISGEAYYLLDNAKETDHRITALRYETGFSYEFNRMHRLNPYVLFDQSHPKLVNELIFGMGYEITF